MKQMSKLKKPYLILATLIGLAMTPTLITWHINGVGIWQ